MGKRFAIVLGIAAAGVIALAATASAGVGKHDTVKIDSKVTLAHYNPFHGRVKSSKHACEVQREVKVFKPRSGPDKLIGKDRSNKLGKWRADFDLLTAGIYYAKVVRREEGTAGTIFVCRGDRSPRHSFPRQS
jgi:hypothetical protein